MADFKYIVETGTIVPDTSVVLLQVQNLFKLAFGSDLDVSPSTPQGLLINIFTLERIGLLANNAQLANQINPNLSGGVFLDAIFAFLDGQRTPASFSTLENVALTGIASTIIPAGSQARNTVTNSLWELVSQATLDGSGNATGTFQAVESGPVTCNIGELTTIVSGVLGWETVNNPASEILGQSTQGDQQARNFRKATLANQSTSLAEAVTTALNKVNGVNSLSFRENIKSTPETIDNKLMDPNSVYVCVDGGLDQDIADALTAKKGTGCDYTGTVIVPTVVPFSSQVIDVKFDRPTIVNIFANVVASASAAIQDPADVIRQSIVDYANGLFSGEPGFIVGADVSPFELSGAINQREPTIFVSDLEISTDGFTFTRQSIFIEIFQKASIIKANINVSLT